MSENRASAAPVPARMVIASIVGLWLCYFVLASARGAIVGFDLSGPIIARRLAVTVASMGITALLWPLLRLLEPRSLALKAAAVLLAALPASMLIAVVNQQAFADIEAEMVSQIGQREGISIRRDEAGNVLVDVPQPPRPATAQPHKPTSQVTIQATMSEENSLRQLSDIALSRYFALLAWAALYLALANAEQARSAERREGEYRRAAKAAELRSLRYQINPHFLFNTLNSLSALVMSGKRQSAERMIQTLSAFYRRSLSDDPTADHSLREEVALQQDYLEIEALRFPDRLRTHFDIPDALAEHSVPGMILQPLIENSVKYAVAATRREVTITVAAREEAGCLVLRVSDNGPGLAKGSARNGPGNGPGIGLGIGLSNVRDRLDARYGARAGVVTGPFPGGYRTELRLPLDSHD